MSKFRGWAAALFGAAAMVLPGMAGAQTGALDDMKACKAVGSTAVRLACFDAAAKGVNEGDVAACAKVSADSVRLACFDAAAGGSSNAGAAAAPAPAATAEGDMNNLDAEMRAREAAMRARIEELQRKAAEVERRTAEIERRTAAITDQGGEKPARKGEFGGKYIDKEPKKASKEDKFGDLAAENDDPLTAEKYGKSARRDEDEESDGEDGEIDKITVKIADIKEGPYGKIKVTLANGQVWKQIDGTRARWHKDGDNVAEIRRAWLGSFLMTINDTGAALRVRRVK